ncbi:MAG: hypothetical protein JO092_12020 [Candidatus Eremiobacteraeota bacterium]|nr:hypothetical protein [Candidatus Eremiobacteraeota bacterium]
MPVFPPAAPVAVLVDGRPLRSYATAYVQDGRVFVPLAPLLLRLADRAWFEGSVLILERDGRSIRVRVPRRGDNALNLTFVPARAIFRQLGDDVAYDARIRQLQIRSPRAAMVALPTPYAAPSTTIAPREVFTPSPPPMSRPTWSGPPPPRRTPLPNPSPAAMRAILRIAGALARVARDDVAGENELNP